MCHCRASAKRMEVPGANFGMAGIVDEAEFKRLECANLQWGESRTGENCNKLQTSAAGDFREIKPYMESILWTMVAQNPKGMG